MFSCAECASGSFASMRGSTSCLLCSPGAYQRQMGAIVCAPCKPGSFAAESGGSACELCMAGTVATGVGGAGGVCLPCAAGTFSSLEGAGDLGLCKPCRSGHFSTGLGQVEEGVCRPCPLGTYAGSDGCVACQEGTFCPPGSGEPVRCEDPGLVCNGSSMEARPRLLPVLVEGNCSGALVCPRGTRCAEGLEDKGVLLGGSTKTHFVVFRGGPLSLQLGCGAVLSYGYARVDGEAFPHEVLFRLLPAGCRQGHFLSGDVCEPCPTGTFSGVFDALSEEACAACMPGTFSSAVGATVCARCTAGTFQPGAGSDECLPCRAGTIQPKRGAAACAPCQPGSFRGASGGIECSPCAAGTFQSGVSATACVDCNSSQFSSSGDAACASCGREPQYPKGCKTAELPANTSSVWVSVVGEDGDECARLLGSTGLRNVKAFRLEAGASCRHSLRVLGRSELSTSVVVRGSKRARPLVLPYNDTFYPAVCRGGEGFAVLLHGWPKEASVEVLDPGGRHLLFRGSCGPGAVCRTGGFCPTQDVRVRVFAKNLEGAVQIRAGLEALECPPTSEWLLSLDLLGPYGPRFPNETLAFDVRVLDAPDRLLAVRLSVRIRPGVTFLSFESSLGEQQVVDGTLEISADCSGAVLVGGRLGRLSLRLDAEHAGLLRVLEVVDARFLLSGGWFTVGVAGQGGSCLRNGYVDVLADFPRCTTLLVEPSRTTLVHWRAVQEDAAVYPMRIAVQGVWNTRGPPQEVDARCLSLTTAVLEVVSCQRIVPRGPGAGLILVRFGALESIVKVSVLVPEAVKASVIPTTLRMIVAGTLLGHALDITPFVLREDRAACPNATVGTVQCLPTPSGAPDTLLLLAGAWTRTGSFRLAPSVLGGAWDRAAPLLFRDGELAELPPLSIGDASRASLSSDGWLSLVRQGASPRCVGVNGGAWRIPVMPPPPAFLDARLASPILVVQQDLLKLVPSSTELVVGELVLTDGTRVDVRDRLRWIVSSGLRVVSGGVQTLYEPGPGSAVLELPGVPCVTTIVNVSVFASSVVSSELACPLCPTVLAAQADPLARRWPERFPSRVPADWFRVRRRLVDGGTHEGLEQVQVSGAGVLDGGYVQATQAGALSVGTAFTGNAVDVRVVDRWATSWRLLCNGLACDPSIKLAPRGDGAAQAPFGYAARLVLGVELTLFNGSTVVVQDPPDVSLLVNGSGATFPEVPLVIGELAILVVFGQDWAFAALEAGLVLHVHGLASLALSVPPVLRQMHCTRVWERGLVSLQAVLSDGTRAAVAGRVETDGVFLRLEGMSVRAMWPGRSRVNASYFGLTVSSEVLVSMDSIMFTGLSLDRVPRVWAAPLLSRLPVRAVLEPYAEGLLDKVVRWQARPEGVVDVLPGGELVLKSDHYEPVLLIGVVRSCQGSPPLVFNASIQVNVVADRQWQVDFGRDGETSPLPVVPVGGLLAVPVYLLCTRPLTGFRAVVSLPGLDRLACTAGELPFSACEQGVLSGQFPASQRVGRLLLGILSGRVLVDGLSRLRVSVEEPANMTYEFTVRLGSGEVHSVLTRLNGVTSGFSVPIAPPWPDVEPMALRACCDVLAVGSRSVIEHLVPSSFRLQNITLEPGAALSLGDPRLRVRYDELLLTFDWDTQAWTVGKMVPMFEEVTAIELWFEHPGGQLSLTASVLVTLTEPDSLIVSPEQLVVRRVHCSPTVFQSGSLSVSLMLRDGSIIPVPPSDLNSVVVGNPALASVTDQLQVTGRAVGNTSLVISAFKLSVAVNVIVLDESILLLSVRLADPYIVRDPEPLAISGVLEDGSRLADASFLAESVTPSSPVVAWLAGLLVPKENTLQSQSIVVVMPACSAAPALVVSARLIVRLQAGLSPDVVVEARPGSAKIILAASSVLAFVITLVTDAVGATCLPDMDLPIFSDCSADAGRIILAGSFSEPRPGPLTLAVITPMPRIMHGVLEVFSGLSSTTRTLIVAGRFGPNVSSLPESLPVADPATLARLHLFALSRPWDRQAARDANFTLQLLTGRQRLVDVRLYSNEFELSAMFGVTDRFLVPDKTGTYVDVVFLSSKLPVHPNATEVPGGIKVRALHVLRGWYAVQWAEAIPHLSLRIKYTVATTTSQEPWEHAVASPLVTGRPLHECPRQATDRASFLVVYRITGPLPADANFACAARVAVKRVSILGPDGHGVVTASVAFESFIRIAQAYMAITMKNIPVLSNHRKLLAAPEVLDLRVINESADPFEPCPPGTYFTRNGTYEPLPNHAVLGPDCYGMACIEGYLLVGKECLPAPVTRELVWVCVIVVMCFGLLLSCIMCALFLGRRTHSQPDDLVLSDPWPDHTSEPFAEDDSEFKNIVLGSSIDDYSKDLLDDDVNAFSYGADRR